ncbi:hypothetical protein VTO42DRAFT_2983 [Malbranchea cinnamomea]
MVRSSEDARSGAGTPLLAGSRRDNSELRPPLVRRGNPGQLSPPELLRTKNLGTWFIWALTLSAGISGLLFGYDTGVISSTLVSIGTDLSHRHLTVLDKSLITSSTSLFALIASPVGGVLGDRLGRKRVIVIADVLFILGSLWQSVTSAVWGMIVGRSLVGLAVGAASFVTPIYISELSPSELRGRMVTILSLFITGGQVVAYVIGWLFSSLPSGWRWMVGLGGFPAVMQLLIVLFLPETPRWLMRAHREREAQRILQKVYGDAEGSREVVERILHDIESEIREEEEEASQHKLTAASTASQPYLHWRNRLPQNWLRLFEYGCNRRALSIACLLQGLQQLCGFNSVMYFSATIFALLNFSSPTLTSLSVAVTNFVFTLLAFALIDRIGRRRMLLYSIPVMTLALLLCAAAFATLDLASSSRGMISSDSQNGIDLNEGTNFVGPIVILLSLTVYTASFASGIGTIPWQQSELFPLSVRSSGSAIATAVNWLCNFVVGLTFLPLMEWISPGWTFVGYAIVCAAGWVVIWIIYPEMTGLGLEDVRGLLAEGWGVEESLRRFERS